MMRPRSINVIRSEICSTSCVVVGRKQDAPAFVGHDRRQFLQDLVARHGIEPGRRLVEHQQAGTPRQHQQQRRLDSLAVRQPFNRLHRPQTEPLQEELRIRRVPVRIDGPDEIHVPGERHPFVQPHIFRREPDIPLGGDLFGGHAASQHAHFTAILLHQPHQDAYGGGLAGPFGPINPMICPCGTWRSIRSSRKKG